MNHFIIAYFAIENALAAILFSYDKLCARKHRRRVPESVLHLLEIAGGAATIIILMYAIRHKNRKFSYYAWTYLALLLWISGAALAAWWAITSPR